MSRKFEVGDRVRVVINKDTRDVLHMGIAQDMRNAAGREFVILAIHQKHDTPMFSVKPGGYVYTWSESYIEHVNPVKASIKQPVKKIKIKIKPMEEILRTVDPAFFKGSIKLLPSYFELMGTEIKTSVRYDAENDVVYLDEKSWHPEWVTLPKNFIIPDKKIRKDLCSYEVNVQADELKVGCQTITKEQELLWFKVLGKRLGYEIKG